MIIYREFGSEELVRVKEIYAEERWLAYLHDDEALKRAFDRSLWCMGAFEEEKLVGFVRCVGDGEHIIMVQDLIVAPAYQGQRIGKTLFSMAWEKYAHVRMFHVVTDMEDERDNHFYQSYSMKPLKEGSMISYYRENEE